MVPWRRRSLHSVVKNQEYEEDFVMQSAECSIMVVTLENQNWAVYYLVFMNQGLLKSMRFQEVGTLNLSSRGFPVMEFKKCSFLLISL